MRDDGKVTAIDMASTMPREPMEAVHGAGQPHARPLRNVAPSASHQSHLKVKPTSMGVPMPVRPGMTFGGRYTVVRALGEGAMGQVFEAKHTALQRRCALKVLALYPCTEKQERRFVREARALASIDSPYVAQVTDFGHEPGVGLYYVMQFVDGETLEQRLCRERRLPLDQAVPLALQLCLALHDVHESGVIHRDIKPSNTAMPFTGPVSVKLLDFGLAVSLENSFIGRVTTSRTLIGSLAYIAPEVIQDHPLTPSVDLYAVGVVLYECLTGRLPFTATTAADFIRQCLTAPIPPFAVAAPELDLPARLEAVVARLLDRDPTQRFSSAAAAARALGSIDLDGATPQ